VGAVRRVARDQALLNGIGERLVEGERDVVDGLDVEPSQLELGIEALDLRPRQALELVASRST
jgi:hypothetical protein